MSSSQKLTLLSGVNVVGPGSAMQWNGGPAVVMAWWDGGVFGSTIGIDFSPDGGAHWATFGVTSVDLEGSGFQLNTGNNGSAAMTSINLPPGMIRAHLFGSVNPNNLSLVIQGYDDALKVPNAS